MQPHCMPYFRSVKATVCSLQPITIIIRNNILCVCIYLNCTQRTAHKWFKLTKQRWNEKWNGKEKIEADTCCCYAYIKRSNDNNTHTNMSIHCLLDLFRHSLERISHFVRFASFFASTMYDVSVYLKTKTPKWKSNDRKVEKFFGWELTDVRKRRVRRFD